MIIGVDLRCLPTDGSAGAGVAHAARFLMQALLNLDVPWQWRLYVPVAARHALPLSDAGVAATRIIELSNASGSSLRRALRSNPCDVLFVPGGSIAPFLSVPAIPWVHDLAIFDHPEWFPQSRFRRWITTTMFRRGIEKALFVFAVSEETKKQIVTKFHIAPEKVIVTHEGGDPELDSSIVYGLPSTVSPFVLFLGTIEPRKNLSMLLNAWKIATSDVVGAQHAVPLRENIELVIAGRDGWKCEEVVREISSTPHIRRIIDCDDEQRRELLRTAKLVVVPSLYEGFGLVALEAMQAGTPLIASNAGSLPEVVGDGGILMDANDVSAWAEAMRSLLVDDVARQRLVEKGKERSKYFSWNASAETVIRQFRKQRIVK